MTRETLPTPRIRRPVWVLIALLVCLVVLVGYQARRARSSTPVGSAAGRSAPRDAAGLGDAPAAVRLEALDANGPELTESVRNPFRFQPRAASPGAAGPAPVAPRPAGSPASGTAAGAPGGTGSAQAGAAPIPLKFIGTIEAPGVGKLAALSDGKFVYHGREGDIIEGRYRIVKIGIESIVMEHVDGRGRQTIRLTG